MVRPHPLETTEDLQTSLLSKLEETCHVNQIPAERYTPFYSYFYPITLYPSNLFGRVLKEHSLESLTREVQWMVSTNKYSMTTMLTLRENNREESWQLYIVLTASGWYFIREAEAEEPYRIRRYDIITMVEFSGELEKEETYKFDKVVDFLREGFTDALRHEEDWAHLVTLDLTHKMPEIYFVDNEDFE